MGWAGTGTLVGLDRSTGTIRFWDDSGRQRAGVAVPPESFHQWPAAAGARLYAGFEDGEVWTIDVATRARVEPTLRVDGPPLSVSATAEGTRVVVRRGRPLRPGEPGCPDHAPRGLREVNLLQWSDDGRTLLAASNDQTVPVYDVASGVRLGDPLPAASPLICPGSLRPDGAAVAVTGRLGVYVWTLEPERLAAAACRQAGRNLTEVEWTTHLAWAGERRATCPEHPL